MPLARFAEVLERAGLSLDAREIAEVFWFAQAIGEAPAVARPPRRPRSASGEEARPSLSSEPTPLDSEERESAPPQAPVVQVSTTERPTREEADGGGVPFAAAAVSMHSRHRLVPRALRALKTRTRASSRSELDLPATIDRSADAAAWLPVLRAGRERGLDLALVVDLGRSMDVWRDSLRGLHRVCTRAGVFRRVTLWGIDTDAPSDVTFHAGLPASARVGAVRSPRELMAPGRDHALIVVTDCVSRAWHDGRVHTLLRFWSASQPVSILHVLPRATWTRTALRRHAETRLGSRGVGSRNAALVSATPVDAGQLPVPVLAWNAPSLKGWAGLMLGRDHARVSGVLLPAPPNRSVSVTSCTTANVRVTRAVALRERVARFRAVSSRASWRLAILLAGAPVLSLPVIHLIRRAMLSSADDSHVAEVLFSGLLAEVDARDVNRAPNEALYEFIPGAREALLAEVRVNVALEVLDYVSRFVERECGVPSGFTAVLHGDLSQLRGSTPIGRRFARVAPEVLRTLGIERERAEERTNGPALDAEQVEQLKVLEDLWRVALERHVRALEPLGAYLRLVFSVGFTRLGMHDRARGLLVPLDREEEHHDARNQVLFKFYRARGSHFVAHGDAAAWTREAEMIFSTAKESYVFDDQSWARFRDRVEWLRKRSGWLRSSPIEDSDPGIRPTLDRQLAEAEAEPPRAASTLRTVMDNRSVLDHEIVTAIRRLLRATLRSGNDDTVAGVLAVATRRLSSRIAISSHRARAIGLCIQATATLGDSEGVDKLLDEIVTLASADEPPSTRNLIDAVTPGIAAWRRLGVSGSARRFLDVLLPFAVRGEREGVVLRAALADGFLQLRETEWAGRLLDQSLEDTLDGSLDHVGRYEAGMAVLAALKHWPMGPRAGRCRAVLESIDRFTDTFTAWSQLRLYETHKVLIAERIIDTVLHRATPD